MVLVLNSRAQKTIGGQRRKKMLDTCARSKQTRFASNYNKLISEIYWL
jgi:hypothetical protein